MSEFFYSFVRFWGVVFLVFSAFKCIRQDTLVPLMAPLLCLVLIVLWSFLIVFIKNMGA